MNINPANGVQYFLFINLQMLGNRKNILKKAYLHKLQNTKYFVILLWNMNAVKQFLVVRWLKKQNQFRISHKYHL